MEDAALPPNWRQAKDSDGKTYYFNELTGETSWDFPGEGGASTVGRETSAGVAVEPAGAYSDPTVGEGPASKASEMPGVMADPAAPNFGVSARAAPGGPSSLEATLGEGGLQRMVILIFCSCVVLISSAVRLDQSKKVFQDGKAEAYGVSVGCISFVSAVAYVWFAKYRPATFSNWSLPKVKGDLSLTQCYAIFLVLWWLPAAAVLTFFSPFLTTSNGYFATWIAFATSILSLGAAFTSVASRFRSMSSIRQDVNIKSLMGLSLSSVVVFFASIEFVDSGEGKFGLIVGIITSALCALLTLLVNRKRVGVKPKKVAACTLLLLWLAAACVLTFDGPFNRTGNGYFGTLFATFCAVSFAYEEIIGAPMPLVLVCAARSRSRRLTMNRRARSNDRRPLRRPTLGTSRTSHDTREHRQ